ncbi:hypothetical protein [Providencia rettgeri]|uniref:hypothetical protein n=1 Tax=Providencia rettgeri TaxID=587 RepID=UPI0023AA7D3E|nr:hypothetical protein [Providencia rettgeri]
MLNVNVNDNYLSFRQYYTILFSMLSDKELSLDNFKKMNSEAKNKDIDTLFNELNNILGHVLKDVDFYSRKIEEKIIPIEQLSFLKNERLSFLFFNYLSLIYTKAMDKMGYKTILDGVMKCSPFNLNPIINRNNIPFNYIVFFIDFTHIFFSPNDFKEAIFDLRNKGLSILELYSKPFSFLHKNEDSLSWIVNRMLNEKIWNTLDINVLLKNERWKAVLSCFDFWAIFAEPSSVKLFLLQARHAWSQKKYRNSVKDKAVLNTYISKEAKKKLKELARKNKKNMNEVIEDLILNNKNLQEVTESDRHVFLLEELRGMLK